MKVIVVGNPVPVNFLELLPGGRDALVQPDEDMNPTKTQVVPVQDLRDIRDQAVPPVLLRPSRAAAGLAATARRLNPGIGQ